MFQVTFYGVGGSTSSASPTRKKYGTNTTCILIQVNNELIIIDMGSGLIRLCENLPAESGNINILLSHYHYDHIEGFPFLKFPKNSTCTIWAEGRYGQTPKELLSKFMQPPYFPVTPKIYHGRLFFRELQNREIFTLPNGIVVETLPLNHPDGVTAFKIIHEGKSLVSLLDYEHQILSDELLSFCNEAELIIYDSFFSPEEYALENYKGWGHSHYVEAAALAKASGAKKLVLAHHANWRSDEELDALGAQAIKLFSSTVMAQEGMVMEL